MRRQPIHVSKVLAQTEARLWRTGTSTNGITLAEWEWRDAVGWVHYDQPGHHTLSLYLEGGEQIVRDDLQQLGGAPDKFCLMPAGHVSRWRVRGPVRMLHFYIEPAVLAYEAQTTFHIDPRQLDLQELTFADDPAISMIARGAVLPLDWSSATDRAALDASCLLMLHRLLRLHNAPTAKDPHKGGLAPSVQRRVIDHVDAHLDSSLTIEDLAKLANLSTFHFARMFRLSVGIPPHGYMAKRRIDRAKQHLREGVLSLTDIARACGYASPSHFSRTFKEATGATPGAWRQRQ